MNFSIQRRLILWLIVVALPISAACVLTVSLVKSSLTQRVIASLENDHRLETARIESALRQYKRIANGLANNRNIRTALSMYSDSSDSSVSSPEVPMGALGADNTNDLKSDPRLKSLMTEISSLAQTMDAGIVEFKISALDGRISDQTAGYSWKPANSYIFEQAIMRQAPVFGDAFLNADGEARLGMVVPIFTDTVVRGSENNFLQAISGTMAIEMRLGPIVDLVEAHEGMGETSESHIAQRTVDGDAQFITLLRFKRDAAFNVVVPESADKPINWALHTPEIRVVRSPDYRHIDSFLAIGTIAETGWGLVVKIDAAEAFIPLRKITDLIWKAGLASLLLLIFSWFTLIRPLALRLQSTAIAADRLATGDYDQLILDSAPDEIGMVSNSIDRLATDLKADKLLREKAERSLKYHAEHDALTGLFNRKYLQDFTETLESDSSHSSFSVLFMDLDDFKAINDHYGHHIGDEILIKFASELRFVLPNDSIASRWGGDEFVVILPSSERNSAESLARLISMRFEKPFATSNGPMSLGCSIGTSTGATCLSVADCVRHADAKMYKTKQARKMSTDAAIQAVTFVRTSLTKNLIDIWYQPIVSTSDGDTFRIIGAEALLRFKGENGKHLLPSEYLPYIHEHELAIELDDKVVSQAFEDLRTWQEHNLVGPDFYVSVNLCGTTARMDSLSAFLTERLEKFQIPARNVVVELSEQTQDIEPEMLSALKNIGVRVAIDDIGLLHSNLERLTSSNADIAKFDQFWVTESRTVWPQKPHRAIEDRKKIVLENLVTICTHLGMDCVIEGVENSQQLSALRQIGIHRFQGYLFDRSLSPEQFSQKLQNVSPSQWTNTHTQEELDLG